MKQEEYLKTIVYNGHMVNIGVDDYGQQYFLEYVKDGRLVQSGCGAYNTDYQEEIEYLFGNPSQCVLFGNKEKCMQPFAHGYCVHCPLNPLVIAREERMKNRGLNRDGDDFCDDEQGVSVQSD